MKVQFVCTRCFTGMYGETYMEAYRDAIAKGWENRETGKPVDGVVHGRALICDDCVSEEGVVV